MKKLFSAFFLVALSWPVFASDSTMRVVYQDFDFYVPDNPETVGYLDSETHLMVLKYDSQPGKKYIGFSFEQDMDTGGCEAAKFFTAVLTGMEPGCNRASVEAFRHVFLDNRESGVWKGEKYGFYYFFGEKLSTVFVIPRLGEANEVLKMDTDFLSLPDMRRLVKAYLQ